MHHCDVRFGKRLHTHDSPHLSQNSRIIMNDDGQKLIYKSCQRLICNIKRLEMNRYTGKRLREISTRNGINYKENSNFIARKIIDCAKKITNLEKNL